MKRIALEAGADLEGFRSALRHLMALNIPPHAVLWDGDDGLFAEDETSAAPCVILPRRVAEVIRLVVCHRDPERYALLHQFVWRIRQGETALPDIGSDVLVHRLHRMEKSVRRDLHKMHAFVRFRRVEMPDGDHFVAWFEPEHFILEATAQFFVDRLHVYALVHSHAPGCAALGPRDTSHGSARAAGGCAGNRRIRGRLARLL